MKTRNFGPAIPIFTTVGHGSTSVHQVRLNQFAVGVLDETSCFEETCGGVATTATAEAGTFIYSVGAT